MLVEVRIKLEDSFSAALDKVKDGLSKAFPLFNGLSREELAVHHAGIHVSNKGRRTVWLRYRVMPEGDAADSAKVPQRTLWVK